MMSHSNSVSYRTFFVAGISFVILSSVFLTVRLIGVIKKGQAFHTSDCKFMTEYLALLDH